MDGLLDSLPDILKLVGHPVRWTVLNRLARSDYRVQELVAFTGLPQNLVSYHLRQLRTGRLVSERRSSADERASYYSLDLELFRRLYLQAGTVLHPALDGGVTNREESSQFRRSGTVEPLRVLFLCTENSARSQMAEALLRQFSHGEIEVFSAGSQPGASVHPLAVRVMEGLGIDMSQAHPRHLEEFRGQHFTAIVTVCDRVREVCPVFPDDPERIHWSFADPAAVTGSPELRYRAFEQTSLQLATRIRLLQTLLEKEHRHTGA